ncbi:MAG TPA: VWA domain-containing protein, partial [Chloroflexia bacterium]|nr:VWA domain-containing protein [Chloroflexia bacterium]
LPPLIVLGLWEGQTVRRRRVALGVARAGAERWRSRLSAIARAAVLSCVLLALAGLQLVQSAGPTSTVYLVDVSDSVSAADRDAAHAYVQSAVAAARPDDRTAVVLFAGQAVVARPLGAAGPVLPFPAPSAGGATDIGGAIRLGLGLLPAGGARRLVLLSDGRETTGQAQVAATQAGAAGVPISVVPLHAGAAHEVAVESVALPGSIPVDQAFEVTVRVTSTAAEGAALSLFEDDRLLATRDVTLQRGGNTFTFPVTAQAEGFHTYRARIAAVDDRWTQNNEASGVSVVQSPPHVLIVAGQPDDGEPLRVALAAAHVDSSVIAPAALAHTLTGLAAYDSIVLANVSATTLGDDTMQALQAYVRDLGRGLVMLGGESSYGAGGYLNTPIEAALPVSMDVRSTQRAADVALAMVVDKSGSMGRCHCGNSGAFRSANLQESGVAKVDIAKEAILKAATTLAPTDRLGVIAFDDLSRAIVPLQPLSHLADLNGMIAGITAGGNTNIFAGLRAATDALEASDAKVKHMILLSDGWSQQTDYDALLTEMHAHNITLSTIAAGTGSSDLLVNLARQGGGRYYAADNEADVPQFFLKETVLATGSYLIEAPTSPVLARAGPIFKDIDTAHLPALRGYNSTTPRATAELLLATASGDPLLAGWQYGLGRSVAWTSDMKGRWATDWIRWPQFPQFAAQLVGWTLPQHSTSGLESNITAADGRAQITVDASDPAGAPRTSLPTHIHVTAPDGSLTDIALAETAPGHYAGSWAADVPGAYQVQVRQTAVDGSPVATGTTSLVVPYAAEYRLDSAPDAGLDLLRGVATTSGGQTLDLATPGVAPPVGASLPARVPAWPLLLTLALLLFPIDVAIRRVTMNRRDLSRLLQPFRRR